MALWNDFMCPLIVLSEESYYTLLAFLFLQRYHIQGVMARSVKG
jgi:ABC-type glycerol-3-phosphate transport system permease component